MELASRAPALFVEQDDEGKRSLLNFAVSNSSWRDGKLTVTLREPFDLILEQADLARSEGPDEEG